MSELTRDEAMREAERRIREIELTEAKELNLSRLGLVEIPPSLRGLEHLERLHVGSNHLKVLPEFLNRLKRLRSLNASDNRLTALPGNISELEELRYLSTWRNRLTSLPESLGQLRYLRRLNVSGNNLMALPESIGQLAQLQVLDISHNRLTALPESLGQAIQLQIFDAAANRLSILPESLGGLNQLQTLDIGVNRLTGLPESFAQLTQLRNLYAGDNRLTALPGGVCLLTELEDLDVSHNWLSELPDSLRDLDSLKELYLHGNDRLLIPLEVLGPRSWETSEKNRPVTPASILDYYFRTRRSSRPLNEAKLILVGRGGVGKTSLVNRLVRGRFNSKEQKTHGIGITGWTLKLGQDQVRLNVWDFGGQEVMHATHQFFLTRRSLYIVVLNAREGEQDSNVEYWLKIIESFGGESPVIVVINKIKDHTFDLNRRGLREKYPAIRDFVQTDCEEGIGIAELRQMIQREADRLENLRDPSPAEWFKIKDDLIRMQQSYMSFEQFRGFCKARGVDQPQSQESLVSVLHRLGIVLNFRDDPRLCDLNVLKPEWVTNGIYKLLSVAGLANAGVLEVADLYRFLDQKDYPPETHGYLIDLMKKFELCFEFEGSKGARYLIPELLGKEEPTLEGWQSLDSLRFQYHYNILPEGLLPRFIVLTNAMSEGRPRWHTGVVLAFDGNEALVKADVQDRRVFITVRGSEEGRRRLLAVIRAQFGHIHRSISKLEAVEKVSVPGNTKAAVAYSHLLKLEERGKDEFWPENADNPIHVPDLLNGYETPKDREKRRLAEWTAEDGGRMGDVIHVHGTATINTGDKSMENIGRDKNTQNISGSTFNNSPVAIRQMLQNSYNTIQQATDEGLKKKLEELHGQVAQLVTKLNERQQGEAKENLEALVKESTKPEPRRKWYDLSAEGLIDAAKSVAGMTAPITATVKELGSLLFPGGA